MHKVLLLNSGSSSWQLNSDASRLSKTSAEHDLNLKAVAVPIAQAITVATNIPLPSIAFEYLRSVKRRTDAANMNAENKRREHGNLTFEIN